MKNRISRVLPKNKNHAEILNKNEDLINDLEYLRENALGIGTRKIKIRLNKLIKNNNLLAKAFRLAMEIEDVSIQAKNLYGDYQKSKYKEKTELIEELIDLAEYNNWEYGRQDSDLKKVQDIVYFELPYCEQISFHTNLNNNIKKYENKWDGEVNSTYYKVIDAIKYTYPEINI